MAKETRRVERKAYYYVDLLLDRKGNEKINREDGHGVDGTGSGSRPVADFGILYVETFQRIWCTRELAQNVMLSHTDTLLIYEDIY